MLILSIYLDFQLYLYHLLSWVSTSPIATTTGRIQDYGKRNICAAKTKILFLVDLKIIYPYLYSYLNYHCIAINVLLFCIFRLKKINKFKLESFLMKLVRIINVKRVRK